MPENSGSAIASVMIGTGCERVNEFRGNYLRDNLRAFGVVAPKVWHDLPASKRSSGSITSFKKNLKTYLFIQAFTS